MRRAPPLLLALAVSSCAVRRSVLSVTCYSGGSQIYAGQLAYDGVGWTDVDGRRVYLSADCVGLVSTIEVPTSSSAEALKRDRREMERCLGVCLDKPKHSKRSCIRSCLE